MRIISKFKDYYDWVIQVPDNKKVYNRVFRRDSILDHRGKGFYNTDSITVKGREIEFLTLYLCGKIYDLAKINGVLMTKTEELTPYLDDKKPKYRWKSLFEKRYWYQLGLRLDKIGEPVKTKINELAPVVIHYKGEVFINPKLSDFGIQKLLSPTEVYQEIYNFIPYDEPKVPSDPDDMSRYEAKGFDKKTSFRNGNNRQNK